MNIVFRVDSSKEIGTGHVMRCLTLATKLERDDMTVSFLCRKLEGNLIKTICEKGFHVDELTESDVSEHCAEDGDVDEQLDHKHWLGVSQEVDAEECIRTIRGRNIDWLIVDHYSLDVIWESRLKSCTKHLMVIDDIADRVHDCDLLLDQNYGSEPQKYDSLVPTTCTLLCGEQYSLLRPEFGLLRKASLIRREQNSSIRSIMISMGGVDEHNYTGQILETLNQTTMTEVERITVVLGGASPHLQKVGEMASRMDIQTTVVVNSTKIEQIMMESDLAIGAVGGTTWERCCLGLPSIVMVIAENQRKIAEKLNQDEIVMLIDSVKQIPLLINNSSSWFKKIFLNSSQIIDGQGASKVICKIKEITYGDF